MSSPNEIRVLRIVKELGEATKRMVAKRFGVTDDYAKYQLEDLHRKGFLEKVAPGRYAITSKGLDELLFTLLHIQGRLKAKIYRAAQQEERIEEKIAELVVSKGARRREVQAG